MKQLQIIGRDPVLTMKITKMIGDRKRKKDAKKLRFEKATRIMLVIKRIMSVFSTSESIRP